LCLKWFHHKGLYKGVTENNSYREVTQTLNLNPLFLEELNQAVRHERPTHGLLLPAKIKTKRGMRVVKDWGMIDETLKNETT